MISQIFYCTHIGFHIEIRILKTPAFNQPCLLALVNITPSLT